MWLIALLLLILISIIIIAFVYYFIKEKYKAIDGNNDIDGIL